MSVVLMLKGVRVGRVKGRARVGRVNARACLGASRHDDIIS